MTTVIKMKASVNNISLPVLNEDGTISNYYIGRFKSALLSTGYELPQDKEVALNAFIEDGINKGWIDYVDYMLPFIGNSDHMDAAFAPLIDRLGDYVIPVPDDTEEHITEALRFSGSDIIGYGRSTYSTNPTYITIPLEYTRYKGISVMTRLNTDNIGDNSLIGNFSSNDTTMIGLRKKSGSTTLQLVKRNGLDDSLLSVGQFDMSDYGTFDLFISLYVDKDDGTKKRNLYIKTIGTLNPSINFNHKGYSDGPVDLSSITDMNFKIKRNVTGHANCALTGNLPYWMAVSPYIPADSVSHLVNAVATLCTALGRDPE